MNFGILAKVARIDERFQTIYVSGFGKDAKMKQVSLGWYVQFEGSQEALFCGQEKPNITVGDEYKISFERIADAIPR